RGRRLQENVAAADVIAIDGVQLKEFDYVDIGSVIELTNVVPIIIKCVLFKYPTPQHERKRKEEAPCLPKSPPRRCRRPASPFSPKTSLRPPSGRCSTRSVPARAAAA